MVNLNDFFQIGNYIFADILGRVSVVIPKDEKLTDEKIAKDLDTLVEFYGANAANYFLECCSEHLG